MPDPPQTVIASPSSHTSTESVVSSVVAACIKHLILVVSARVSKYRLSLRVDTGSYVNVLSEAAFLTLKRKFRGDRLHLRPSNLNLSGIQGSNS